MNIGMIILNQNIRTIESYAIWMLTASLFISKPKISIKIFQMILKNSLIHQTIMKMIIDYSQEV